MKNLLLFFLLISSAAAQISGAGQVGCNAAATTGTAWTSATAQNTVQILASGVAGVTVVVALDQTTTLSAGAVQFLGDYGDGNFINVGAWQVSDPTTSPFALISMPYTLQASTNKTFRISMGGMSRLELKLTTAITGSGQIQPFTTVVCYNDQKAWSDAAGNFLSTVSPGSGVFQVGPTASANTAGNPFFTEPTDGTNGMGAMANFGTAPSAVKALNANANIYQGGAAIAVGNPLFTNLSDGTNNLTNSAITTWATAPSGKVLGVNATGTTGHNGAAATTNRLGTLPGIVQTSPNNGTAATQGRDTAVNVGTDGTLWTSNMPPLRPARYSASASFPASSTTDNACIYGNGTNTVVLTRVEVNGVQTTAGLVNVQLIRRSAAETGGTSANMTVVRGDVTNYAAASTTPVSYTGTGPTAGAAVGTIRQGYTQFNAATAAVSADTFLWNGNIDGPQVLINTSQGICVNLGNAALTGGTVNVNFNWLEIANISE